MSLGPRIAAVVASAVCLALASGCGQTEGRASHPAAGTVTLGQPGAVVEPTSATEPTASSDPAASPVEAPTEQATSHPAAADNSRSDDNSTTSPTNPPPADPTRTFKVEGPEEALRVSYDDIDLLKVMNLDPVPPDAPERLPAWLKALDGKRIRIRGFMYPPFQDTDIRGFVLARDNQICCFGRTPKEYDLIEVFLRKGVTTYYIQNRPFDVVGVFRIKSDIEKYTAMYEMEDAIVIEK